MHITLLCNAGLALTHDGQTLLVDVPNQTVLPFYGLPDEMRENIISRTPPYDTVCGLCYTHTHADHCDMTFLAEYRNRWPGVPIYYPMAKIGQGSITVGAFTIEYCEIPHAPMDEEAPPHVALLIQAGEKSVYIAGDAVLNPDLHQAFLKDRRADAAFWNSMYISRPETRQLLKGTAASNYIYHMPAVQTDSFGIWKKCQRNLERSADELKTVTILDQYPTKITI